jgi:shikimate dehydrogenase
MGRVPSLDSDSAEPRLAPQGSTRLYAIIGDPVAQVQAPTLMNAMFAQRGVDAVMVAVHVTPGHFDSVVTGLQQIGNFDGLLITVPHKIAVLQHADHAGPAAQLAGSANALRREPDGTWLCDNFDGAGFVAGLRRAGHEPAGKIVALVGAGGAGAAIAAALVQAGVGRLSITDADAGKASALAGRLDAHTSGAVRACATAALDHAEIAINATPMGLRPADPLPFEPQALPGGALVVDIIMKPAETRLLQVAAARGLATHPGLPMLLEQAELYWRFFGLPQPS